MLFINRTKYRVAYISNLQCVKIKSIQDVWQMEVVKISNKVRVADRIRQVIFLAFSKQF